MKNRAQAADNAFVGFLLTGIGVLAHFDWWWPGIMFVIALAKIVQSFLAGNFASTWLTIVILLAIGGIGFLGKVHLGTFQLWPLLFIVIGLVYLGRTFWQAKG